MSPDPVTKTCPICWNTFTATGRNATKHTYCTARCRKAAFERTRKPATPSSPRPTEPPAPARPQAAAHRDCPHCGGPITIVALLTTPEAARPHLPAAAPNGVIPLHRP